MYNCIPAYCAGAHWDSEADRLERSARCGKDIPWEPCTRELSNLEQIQQGSFAGLNLSLLKPHEQLTVDPTSEAIFGIKCQEGFFRNYLGFCQPNFHSASFGEFISDVGQGLITHATIIGSAVASGGTSIAISAATEIARGVQEQTHMGIDLGGIFGGVATTIGGLAGGNYLGALQGAAQLGTSFFAHPSQPAYAAAMPSYGIAPYSPPMTYPSAPQPQAQPVGAFGVAGRAIAVMTAPILTKIAVKLGLRARPSLTRAMDMVRKAAKILTSPEAVATALGITVAELATLITTSNARKRRRMNPANSKALRRAARRIKSFHRLCTHTDVLRSRGRSRASVARCVTCRKSPCRC